MKRSFWIFPGLIWLVFGFPWGYWAFGGEKILPAKPKTCREGLLVLQELIGDWRSFGQVNAKKGDKSEKETWSETAHWQWYFKGETVCLKGTFDKGKYFLSSEIHYAPETSQYCMDMETVDKKRISYKGQWNDSSLVLNLLNPESNETERLVIRVLHGNRMLMRMEIKPADQKVYNQVFQIGATKEGVEFAEKDWGKECIVSGGAGTMVIIHKGLKYYVCCTGCRSAFLENPEKYIPGRKSSLKECK